MAPTDKPDHNLVEQQVKDVIQDLFQIMVQVSTYDTAGKPSREVLANELQTLSSSLRNVHRTASSPSASLPMVPDLLVTYVENGRNPDIYTREFVELVRRMNQLARGKMRAFVQFRDVLAREMAAALPELRADVDRVIEATGGKEPIAPVVQPAEGPAGGRGGGAGGGGEGEGTAGRGT